MAKTLVEKLSPLADKLRGLNEKFGTRPYDVVLVAVRRYGRDHETKPGQMEIVEETTITPTPRVRQAANTFGPAAIGWIEQGDIVVDEISFDYSFEDLIGTKWNEDDTTEFFWEIRQKIPKESNPRRRQFRTKGFPENTPTKLGWKIVLEEILPERSADGLFDEPY